MSLSQDVSGAGATRSSCCPSPATTTASPAGFLRLVPASGPTSGYSLDLMRHEPDAPNGMTEFLIARPPRRSASAGWRACR